MGTVSAIVSAYFAEEFIRGRIENLMNQRPRPEIVVVAQSFSPEAEEASRYKEVVLFVTPDVPTLYDAWNIGIQMAHGDYVTNANSDDLLYPGALWTMANVLDEDPSIALCYADSDVTREYNGDPVNRMCWIQGGVEEIKLSCFMGSMPMWRRSLHSKYGYFDATMKSAGDYEFWLHIMMEGEKVKHIPQALGAYLERPDSIWHSKPVLSIWEVARARSKHIKEQYGSN